MTGFFKKEWYLIAKQMRFWIFFLLIYSALSATQIWGGSMMASMLCVILLSAPMSLFSQDRTARWDGFSAALPDGRRHAVQARYLFTLLLSVCCILFAVAVSALFYALGLGAENNLAELLAGGIASVALCLFFTAVLLPLLYRFGPEKARFLIILIYLVLVVTVIAFFSLVPQDVIAEMSGLFLSLLILLLLVSLYGSYRLSLSIVRGQEF